ncbi:hypothetical protein Glove_74g254 [Diversispora epigaea]|uniref:Uncharacterized protein n=1 Tax=Diversispora epigaea TaxID=1348612 RepID=A0A397J8Z3_9GLOM|nr:hypothetical protein Glove_74g254 [Diversispora epigaea]
MSKYILTSPKFGTSNQVGINDVSPDTNLPMDQNSPDTIYSSLQFVNTNQISPDITCCNSLLMNTDQNSLGTICYNSPPSISPEAIYSSHPDATYSNLPVDKYPLEITFTDPSNMDQIFPGITCYNSPFLNIFDTIHVNSPPSDSLNTIYSSQNSPYATYSNLPIVQCPLETTFPNPLNMDQISSGITCYNSLLMNTEQNSPDITCYSSQFLSTDQNSLPLYAYQNGTNSYYPFLNKDQNLPIISDNFLYVNMHDDEPYISYLITLQ